MSANVSLVYSAQLSTSAASIAVGQVVCIDPTTGKYVPATSAARVASGGIVSGVALTEASTGLPGFAILLGGTEVPPAVSGLAAGVAAPVICNASGIIERKAVPVPGTDCIIGDAYADGTVVLSVGSSQKASGATVPTGTGFPHIVAGAEDAAAKLVEDADVDAGAAIDVTKLALGGAGEVIGSDGMANAWGAVPGLATEATARTTADSALQVMINQLWPVERQSALAGVQDNFDVTISPAGRIHLYFTAGATTVTGFVAPLTWTATIVVYHPLGLTLSLLDAGSAPDNQIQSSPLSVVTSCTLVYNTTLQKWVVVEAENVSYEQTNGTTGIQTIVKPRMVQTVDATPTDVDVYEGVTDSVWTLRATCVGDRKSTRLNSSHIQKSRMPSSA